MQRHETQRDDPLGAQPSGAGLKRALAIGLLVLVGGASLLRLTLLSMNLPSGGFLISTMPIVHAVHLLIFCMIAPFLFVFFRRSRAGRVALSLALSAFLIVLVALDFSIVVASGPLKSIISLRMLATFYCGTSGYLACALSYPTMLISLIAALVSLAAILLYLFDQIADCVIWLRDKIGQALRRFIPISHRVFVALSVGLYCVANLGIYAATAAPIHIREPLYQLIVQPPPALGPNGLFVGSPADKPPVAASSGMKPKTLVLIVVDSLRADSVLGEHNGQPLMPFLASQIAEGTIKDLGPAIAICPSSYCGMIGIQSSRTWDDLDAGPPLLLSDVLAANGYSNVFFGSGRTTTTANLGSILNSNFGQFLDDTSEGSSDLLDDREQIQRLRNLKPVDPAKTYISIHLMSAHYAGLRFHESASTDRKNRRTTLLSRGDYPDQYAEGVRQADGVIEEIFKELDRKGMLDDATVIITADHGERVVSKTKPGHGDPLDLDVARIPMLIYSSREMAWPNNALISQIDIAPTLLKAVNIDQPKEFVGKPLQEPFTRNSLIIQSGKDRKIITFRNGEHVISR